MSVGDAFDSFNEKVTLFLLRFVGPPQVGGSRTPPAPDEQTGAAERSRDTALRGQFERVTGPDGRPYLVER